MYNTKVSCSPSEIYFFSIEFSPVYSWQKHIKARVYSYLTLQKNCRYISALYWVLHLKIIMKAFSEINKNSLENKFNMRRCDDGTLFSIERRSIICVLRQLNGEASWIFNCFCHRLQSYELPGNTNHWMPKKLDLNVTSLTLNPLWVAGKWIPIVLELFYCWR